MKNKKHTKESKILISLGHTGKKYPNRKKGHKLTKEHKRKIGEAGKEEKSGSWKGDNVGYFGLHIWLHKKLGKATKCENPNCKYPRKSARGIILLKPTVFQWANVSKNYKRDIKDWIQLCISCHQKWDRGTVNKIII